MKRIKKFIEYGIYDRKSLLYSEVVSMTKRIKK